MNRLIGASVTAALCVGLGAVGVVAATPAGAASERIVLHALAYENKPDKPIRFECLASPSLVGKIARIKEVGGAFQGSVKVKANGSCDISAMASGLGEHSFVVVIEYELANGKNKTVRSHLESAFSGNEPT